jgi:hypothetical protein
MRYMSRCDGFNEMPILLVKWTGVAFVIYERLRSNNLLPSLNYLFAGFPYPV